MLILTTIIPERVPKTTTDLVQLLIQAPLTYIFVYKGRMQSIRISHQRNNVWVPKPVHGHEVANIYIIIL